MTDSTELHVIIGTGALGRAVMRELVARNKPVRMVNRTGRTDVPDGVEIIAADVSNPDDARRACQGATVVYNCAGAPYDKWPELWPPLMDGVIEGAASANAKLVFGDNLYMYGPVDGPITEDLPYNATTSKGRVRAQIATALMDAHARGKVRATIGRGSDFFGPFVLASAIGERVFRPALTGKAASILGNPDMPHTYTYIDDFGRALVILGEHDEALGQIWHVPNDKTLTTREFLELIYQEAGHPLKMSVMPNWMMSLLSVFISNLREVKEMMYEFEEPFVVSSDKFEKAFGMKPTPHPEAIRKTLDWFRQNPS